MRAEADDIGFSHCLLDALNCMSAAICRCELFCMFEMCRCNAYLGKLAHKRKHLQMSTSLDTSSDNRQYMTVRSCQQSSRESRSASGTKTRNVAPIHE